ncbi:MAG: hypothetical protein K2X53_04695 [Alphaproteobacteria bacterium]|nr:hypothetical protein [Alphaproteobacteria bacterium]
MKKSFIHAALIASFLMPSSLLFGTTAEHEHLGAFIAPKNPKSIRILYENDIKAFRAHLGTTEDKSGYGWHIPMQGDRDLHMSLMTFKKGAYTNDHVNFLKDLLNKHKNIVPQNGKFLRIELWLKNTTNIGATGCTHFVHPEDFTKNEETGNKANFFDPAVQSIKTLTSNDAFDSGHLVLRYASKGELSKKTALLMKDLKKKAVKSNSTQILKDNLDEFGPNFIAHMTIARILRCKNNKASEQQPIKGKNLLKLITAFNSLRNQFQRELPAGKSMKMKSRDIPFTAEQINLTSGLRSNRKILMTVKSGNN